MRLPFSFTTFPVNKQLLRFFATALFCYSLWIIVYKNWLQPAQTIDLPVIHNSVLIAKAMLEWLGYTVFNDGRLAGIGNSASIFIGDPCNCISLFALYAGFIISFPGKIKYKFLFVPAGIAGIHFLNSLRIASLLLIHQHYPSMLNFNHKYTFSLMIYAFIFLMWMLWVNRYSVIKSGKAKA